tara:strand:+ start:2210 stop:2416 length:207 start_codon:yes stop_codon:yes gene_type:complete
MEKLTEQELIFLHAVLSLEQDKIIRANHGVEPKRRTTGMNIMTGYNKFVKTKKIMKKISAMMWEQTNG